MLRRKLSMTSGNLNQQRRSYSTQNTCASLKFVKHRNQTQNWRKENMKVPKIRAQSDVNFWLWDIYWLADYVMALHRHTRRGTLLSYLRRKTWFRMSNGATNSRTTDSINPKIGHAIQRQRGWENTHTEINRPFRREKFDQAERRKTRKRFVLTQCSLFSLTAAKFSDYYRRRKASRAKKKIGCATRLAINAIYFAPQCLTHHFFRPHESPSEWKLTCGHFSFLFFNREKEMDSGILADNNGPIENLIQ